MPLSEEERAFVDGHRVARLATADTQGVPHVVPIVYARVGDVLYFVIDEKPKRTRTGLKRLRNIEQNPQVALVIDDYDDDWTRLAYLLVQGHAARVDDPGEFTSVLAVLRQRYVQYRSMTLEFGFHPMVRITVTGTHSWKAN